MIGPIGATSLVLFGSPLWRILQYPHFYRFCKCSYTPIIPDQRISCDAMSRIRLRYPARR